MNGERAMTLRGWFNLRKVGSSATARHLDRHRNTMLGWLSGQRSPDFLEGMPLARMVGITPEALELAIRASRTAHEEALRAAGKARGANRPSPARLPHPRTAAATAPAAPLTRRGEVGR